METITKTVAEVRRDLLAERVERGVALLDREMPDWWRTDRRGTTPNGVAATPIDLDRLDMCEPGWCVLGQLEMPGEPWSYWSTATRMLGSQDKDRLVEIEHGVFGKGGDYPILTDLWREVIEKRRANA